MNEEYISQILAPPCLSELGKFFYEMRASKIKQWPSSLLDKTIEKLKANKRPDQTIPTDLVRQIKLKYLNEARKMQLQRLKDWEQEINDTERSQARIAVENKCDLEGPPRHMKYITTYKVSWFTHCFRGHFVLPRSFQPAPGLIIPSDPPIGCDCDDCFANSKRCCPSVSGGNFAYNKFGRLKLGVGMPIFECNKTCKCNSQCSNRVVQRGRKVQYSVTSWQFNLISVINRISHAMHHCLLFLAPQVLEKFHRNGEDDG